MNRSTDIVASEVIALRYARRDSTRAHGFLGDDAHDVPMAMDYFVWAIRIGSRTIVVDTGFTRAVSERRRREYLADPVELLHTAGYPADTITDVIITHLHYDHAGNLDRFPNATYHIQEAEVAYATGRYMCFGCLRKPFEVDDVTRLVQLVYRERVQFHDGDSKVHPNVELYRVGGHTAGMQCVRVKTARGWVVLASDVSHYYENFLKRRPFPAVLHVGEMVSGFELLEKLADSTDHVIPGHDPLVLKHYPPLRADLAGQAVRLDVAPVLSI